MFDRVTTPSITTFTQELTRHIVQRNTKPTKVMLILGCFLQSTQLTMLAGSQAGCLFRIIQTAKRQTSSRLCFRSSCKPFSRVTIADEILDSYGWDGRVPVHHVPRMPQKTMSEVVDGDYGKADSCYLL
ncbi:hypothetical protein LIA77_11253 [Sarocladium implicatum]|nr:hypothetical protein LIA77_11253 [Sarocladium implicatum]